MMYTTSLHMFLFLLNYKNKNLSCFFNIFIKKHINQNPNLLSGIIIERYSLLSLLFKRVDLTMYPDHYLCIAYFCIVLIYRYNL